MASAACADASLALFYPPPTQGRAPWEPDEAREICARCPVIDECLTFAYATGERYGVWGGQTPAERGMGFKVGRHRAVCNTVSGYLAHLGRGEEPCDRCQRAFSHAERVRSTA